MNGNSWKFLFVILALTMAGSAMVDAATITVNDLNDNDTAGDGNCTLREAINNANSNSDTTSSDCTAGSGVDTITFSLSGTITLGSQLPGITDTDELTIDATGQNVNISGNDAVVIVAVSSGVLSLNELTILNGMGSGVGGIFNQGTLRVTNSNFLDNNADGDNGGGITNSFNGTLTVIDSLFAGNSAPANGGGIANFGTLTVSNSIFENNNADGDGGAIFNSGSLTVTNSTFVDNTAEFGGGMFNSGTLTVTNSTFAENTAAEEGGGVYNQGGTLGVLNSTFSGNSAPSGGGILNADTLVMFNTIIANSQSGGDCVNSGTLVLDTNLIEDNSCFATFSGDPMLDPNGVSDNGGLTLTIALLEGSAAIDQGDATTCSNAPVNNLDQRGFSRPVDGDAVPGAVCDIGAFEFVPQIPQIEAAIDIKFCSNPNAFNCKKKGVLPVTIFGTDSLDVSEMNISTVELCLASDPNACVSLIDAEFPQDRGNPETDLGINSCLSANPDGFDDLGVLFVAREVAQLIECSTIGKGNVSPTLIIKGELNDGTQFQSTPVNEVGIDQLRIVTK